MVIFTIFLIINLTKFEYIHIQLPIIQCGNSALNVTQNFFRLDAAGEIIINKSPFCSPVGLCSQKVFKTPLMDLCSHSSPLVEI